ncbi:unnamed protein product [Trichobilharzia regenti]|nr:unnamed protein product [Trichobilharzia regenti]
MKDVINRLPGHYKRRYLENQNNLANENFLATSLIAKEEIGAVFPKVWRPDLMEQLFHSEILNRWMVIIVSKTALKQIEESGGFDFYILSLEEAEWIGLTLEEAVKKQMKIEHEIARSQIKPLKLVLAENLIDKLINSVEKEKGEEGEKSSGYLSKFFNRQTSGSKSV